MQIWSKPRRRARSGVATVRRELRARSRSGVSSADPVQIKASSSIRHDEEEDPVFFELDSDPARRGRSGAEADRRGRSGRSTRKVWRSTRKDWRRGRSSAATSGVERGGSERGGSDAVTSGSSIGREAEATRRRLRQEPAGLRWRRQHTVTMGFSYGNRIRVGDGSDIMLEKMKRVYIHNYSQLYILFIDLEGIYRQCYMGHMGQRERERECTTLLTPI